MPRTIAYLRVSTAAAVRPGPGPGKEQGLLHLANVKNLVKV